MDVVVVGSVESRVVHFAEESAWNFRLFHGGDGGRALTVGEREQNHEVLAYVLAKHGQDGVEHVQLE